MPLKDNHFNKKNINIPPNPKKRYWYTDYDKAKGFTLLIKWMIMSKQYPFLINKIKNSIREDSSIINTVFFHDMTLLNIACSCKTVHIKVIKFLLENGSDINTLNYRNQTPLYNCLYYFMKNRVLSVTKLLLILYS